MKRNNKITSLVIQVANIKRKMVSEQSIETTIRQGFCLNINPHRLQHMQPSPLC